MDNYQDIDCFGFHYFKELNKMRLFTENITKSHKYLKISPNFILLTHLPNFSDVFTKIELHFNLYFITMNRK